MLVEDIRIIEIIDIFHLDSALTVSIRFPSPKTTTH